MANDATIWGIHAGRDGDGDALFLQNNCVAIGWPEAGDFTGLPSDREAYRQLLAKTYPQKVSAHPAWLSVLFRFVHEMREGDLVAYPSKVDRQIHLGTVIGPAVHLPKVDALYTVQRSVKWLKAIPRTSFSQGALYEIGSALTLFQIKNYADEVWSALQGSTLPPEPATDDETVSYMADEIESATRDFILKQLARDLKGHPFAHFVAHLLQAMGYRTRISPEGPDGGIDIVAHRDELGFEPPILKVQVKAVAGSTGDPVVSALYGKVDNGEFGLLVTLGTFTAQARTFARSKSNLRLIDGAELVELVLQHYEQFDSRYKGLLPLRHVFIPESLRDS